jgi:hypothetical protein
MLALGDFFSNKDFTNQLVGLVIAFISGVLSPIVTHWAKKKFEKKENPIEEEETDEILKLLHANEMIDKRIETIRSEYNFDRVWIGQFHNGGAFFPIDKTLKFQKFSLTYEACKKGISSELSAIQNIPVSVFSAIFRIIKERGDYGVHDITKAADDSSLVKSFWSDRGVSGFHIFAIKSIDKKFFGILVIECLAKCVIPDDVVQNLVVESKILGGYLAKNDLD